MRLMSEKSAEDFLEKEGFMVVERGFVKNKRGIQKIVKEVGLPCVMKVSGNRIVHKRKLKGVKNINTYSESLYEFSKLMRIKGSNGVLIQKKFPGKEFLIGIKKTPEFEHVLVFGFGGTKVEEKKDVSFRVCPIDKKEVRKMIKETKIGKILSKKLMKCLQENILKLCKLIEKYPNISELDLNPFTFSRGEGKIVDARIVFEE